MKIIFAGTPDFAVAPLQKIIESGFEVVGAITQTDKPQGRKGILTPPPVKVLAEKYSIPLLQPEKIRDCVDEVKALGGDIMVTCAYGQILTGLSKPIAEISRGASAHDILGSAIIVAAQAVDRHYLYPLDAEN